MLLDFMLYGAYGLGLVGFLVAIVRMGMAQRDFFRIYDERANEGRPLSSEGLAKHYLNNPSRWFRDSPGMAGRSFDALWTPQTDPAVERARHQAAQRSLVPFAVLVIMMFLLFIPWHDL